MSEPRARDIHDEVVGRRPLRLAKLLTEAVARLASMNLPPQHGFDRLSDRQVLRRIQWSGYALQVLGQARSGIEVADGSQQSRRYLRWIEWSPERFDRSVYQLRRFARLWFELHGMRDDVWALLAGSDADWFLGQVHAAVEAVEAGRDELVEVAARRHLASD
jgi:hypothetical protein